MTLDPCSRCVAESRPRCLARETGARRLCELVDRCGPAYTPEYEAVVFGDPRPVAVVAEPHIPARPDHRRNLLAGKLARSCPYREQCGCVYADCSWKGRKVTLNECVECLESTVLAKRADAPDTPA